MDLIRDAQKLEVCVLDSTKEESKCGNSELHHTLRTFFPLSFSLFYGSKL